MNDRDEIQKERERKDAEMHRQEQLGEDADDQLHGYDKADADSFPASDPPAASTNITGVIPEKTGRH